MEFPSFMDALQLAFIGNTTRRNVEKPLMNLTMLLNAS
jgi:hypothetical protein